MDKDKKRFEIDSRRIAITAIYVAIVLVMNMVPFLGYIELPLGRMTFLVIPVVLAAVNEGLLTGAAAGATFGVSSFVKSFTQPNVTSFLFNNPLISVVPRMLIGVTVYFVFKFFKKINFYLAAVVSAITGVVTNTGLVMLMSIIFYGSVVAENGKVVTDIALGWISLNFVFELIACLVVVPAVVVALNKIRKPVPVKKPIAPEEITEDEEDASCD